MTQNRLFLLFAALASLILSGCGSSPANQYYVLSAHSFSASSDNAPSVGVGPIETPEYLSRENMVLRSTKNYLEVSADSLWAEPLDSGIQRVLILNLAGQLKTQNVESFPWHPRRAPDYGVKVSVLTMDANTQVATLTAEWLVYRPSDSKPVNRRISQLQRPLSSGTPAAEQVAEAYSDLLFQLSEIISAAIEDDLNQRTQSTGA
tara:strand:+ start:52056 stop:52670 length:615 start_codon:yes stop_codon:yes gene_type:complete